MRSLSSASMRGTVELVPATLALTERLAADATAARAAVLLKAAISDAARVCLPLSASAHRHGCAAPNGAGVSVRAPLLAPDCLRVHS